MRARPSSSSAPTPGAGVDVHVGTIVVAPRATGRAGSSSRRRPAPLPDAAPSSTGRDAARGGHVARAAAFGSVGRIRTRRCRSRGAGIDACRRDEAAPDTVGVGRSCPRCERAAELPRSISRRQADRLRRLLVSSRAQAALPSPTSSAMSATIPLARRRVEGKVVPPRRDRALRARRRQTQIESSSPRHGVRSNQP